MALGLLFACTAGAAMPYGWSTQGWGDGENISAEESAGVWQVTCDGSDFWGTSDRGGMVYRQFDGDFDVSCRVVTIAGRTGDTWTRGGIMARDSLNANSRNVLVYWKPTQGGSRRVDFNRRESDGGGTARDDGPVKDYPTWLRLTRTGNTFKAYNSDDGVNWTQFGANRTITMAANLYLGLAVASHNGSETTTYTFDNVKGMSKVDNAGGATGVGINTATLAGNLNETNGATHVWAYWGEADQGVVKTDRSNQLHYAFYDFDDTTSGTLTGIDDGLANGQNGGLFAMQPSVTNRWPAQVLDKAIWTNEVHQGVNKSDTYCEMWWGALRAPETGTYTFYIHGDDYEVLWIDTNQNWEFEADAGELICVSVPPDGWDTPKTETVTLTAGEVYAFAIAHDEGSGGDTFTSEIQIPSAGSRVRINPGAVAQDGWWFIPAWTNSEYLGTQPEGTALATNLTGLVSLSRYFYRYYASNSTWEAWAPWTETFLTLSSFSWDGSEDDLWATAGNWAGGNVPNTAGEEAIFGGTGVGDVDINGSSYTVNYIDITAGDYTFINSGGAATLTAGSLTHSGGDNRLSASVTATGPATVSGGTLTVDGTLSVGAAAEVSGGTLALEAIDDFSATGITLSGGTLEIDGTISSTSTVPNALEHRGYNGESNDSNLDLNNNGGLMSMAPYGTAILTDGPGSRGLDFDNDGDFTSTGAVGQNDNYANLFIGYFIAPTTGNYQFRINQDDDRSGIWLDRDRDGVFESTVAGLGSDRGEQLRWENQTAATVTLTNGLSYLVGFVHREGGGGSGIHVMFKTPAMSSETTVKPGDPAQAGMWAMPRGQFDATGLPAITVTADSTLNVAGGGAMPKGAVVGDVTLSAGTLSLAAGGGAEVRLDSTSGSGGLSANGPDVGIDTASSMGTLLGSNGSTVTGATITVSTLVDLERQVTIRNVIAGGAELHVGDDDNYDGVSVLTGINTYSGLTRINRGVLRADDGVGLPANSTLRFYQNNRDQTCILETSGTFDRNIGTGAGEVYWENRGGGGGFAALGGDLTVDLEGGVDLTWNNAGLGFNRVNSLQFGSRSADSLVELKNNIALDGSTRQVQTIDNQGAKTDVVRLSGNITGGGTAHRFRFHESSGNQFNPGDNLGSTLVELTGTNTYLHETSPEECTLYAIEGMGLPVNSMLRLEGNSDNRHAIFMSAGTMNRNIGGGAGEVYWGSRGGFAARGGSFTVTLEGGAQLNWGDGNTGFRGQRLQLNSVHADDAVEITNPIDLNASERHIYVWENDDSKSDVAILSGNIVGSNGGTWLRKWRKGVLWLQGTNTYSQRTFLDEGVIHDAYSLE